ncbi:MAG TPA: VOC family protein [Thermoanaerobaculaceae bacterium]|nr:VOC family protein [Thermoanaerobaculaceae bacterium]
MAKVNPTPKGLHTLTPNLTIKGCAKAIDFYKAAFGAEQLMLAPAPDGSSVWHAELKIGNSVIFLNDEMPGMGPGAPSAERPAPVGLWLYVKDCDAAYDRAVKAGAKGANPPIDMFWGDRCALVADPFGYRWTIATRVKEMTEEEQKRGAEEFAKQMAAKH